MRFLVIEQDDATRHALVRALDAVGHVALGARDGHGALALVLSGPLDVVVVDPDAPGADRIATACHRRAAVICATAAAPIAAAASVERLGGSGFLVKPFRLDTLLQITGSFEAPNRRTGERGAARRRRQRAALRQGTGRLAAASADATSA
jgi:DNA-binding NtrC family response regulator